MSNGLNTKLLGSFREFLLELNRYEVEYLLIGGYAIGDDGHIRTTGDDDSIVLRHAAVKGRNKARQ